MLNRVLLRLGMPTTGICPITSTVHLEVALNNLLSCWRDRLRRDSDKITEAFDTTLDPIVLEGLLVARRYTLEHSSGASTSALVESFHKYLRTLGISVIATKGRTHGLQMGIASHRWNCSRLADLQSEAYIEAAAMGTDIQRLSDILRANASGDVGVAQVKEQHKSFDFAGLVELATDSRQRVVKPPPTNIFVDLKHHSSSSFDFNRGVEFYKLRLGIVSCNCTVCMVFTTTACR